MWPFKQKVEAPAADGPRPVPAPVIRRDWVGLPPIQRVVGAHPLTAPSDRFRDDLTTHQDPSVSSDTMGHQISAEAPPGLVLALARPTTRSDGPAMIPRPRLQRSAAGAVAESGEWDGDGAAPELARPTPLPPSAPAVASPELPVVAAEPAVQRLISLPPDAAPTPVAPVAQRSAAVPSPFTMPIQSDAPAEMAPVPAQRLTLGQSRRMGLGAPIKRVPDRSVQRETSESSMDFPLRAIPQNVRETVEPSPSPPEPKDTAPVERAPMDLPLVGKAPTNPPMVQTAPVDLPLTHSAPMDLPMLQRSPIDLPIVFESPTDLPSPVSGTRTSTDTVPLTPSFESSNEARLDLPLAHRVPEATSAGDGRAIAPPAASVQLSATSSAEASSDSSSPGSSALQRLADVGGSTPSSTESRRALPSADAPTTSVQRVSTSSLPLATASPARASTVPSASTPDMAMAPLVGARPLRPSTAVQRSSYADGPAQTDARHPDPPPQGGRELPLSHTPHPDPAPDATEPRLQRGMGDTASTYPLPQGGSEIPSMSGREISSTARLRLAPSRGIAVQRAAQAAEETEPA